MKKQIIAILLLAVMIPAAAGAWPMYVYSQNGKNVNVRSGPYIEAEQWGSVAYGTQVDVLETQDGWSWCSIPGFQNGGWIKSSFLTSQYPGRKPYNPDQDPAAPGYSYSGFRAVGHFEAYVNHPTSTFLNLRWAPSESAAVIRRCYNGTRLTVYAVSDGWYQVYDEQTGFAGFMRPNYLERLYY